MRIPRGWLEPFPWREAAHLAFGLFTGLALLATLVVALILSPMVVFVPALPLAAMVAFVRIGGLEPSRFRAVLGEDLPLVSPIGAGEDQHSRWRSLVADAGVLGLAAYSLVRGPLAVLEVGVFTAVFTWPLLMLATAVRALATGVYPEVGPFAGGSWLMLAVGIVVALVLILVVTIGGPVVIRQLARLDLVVTRALLVRPDQDLENRVGELVAARTRVVGAAEAERTRIERDLHDGAQQRLIALGISLGRAEERLARHDPSGETLELVRQAKAETMGVVSDIRDLTSGLRPPILESRGLDAALSAVASRLALSVEIKVDVGRLDPAVEAVLYFAMTECLTNVVKHAPGAHATVRISRMGGIVQAVVSDDGPGGAELSRGTGLSGIADRLAGVDGQLWLSSPSGGPTAVRLEVPCAS